MKTTLIMLLVGSMSSGLLAADKESGWQRHIIDSNPEGVDHFHLGDANHDGYPDIASASAGLSATRIHLNPGPHSADFRWPTVQVAKTKSVTGATFFDFDGDGVMDVISSSEGWNNSLAIHFGPKNPDQFLDPKAWTTRQIPGSRGKMPWTATAVMQVDGLFGFDLIAGGKGWDGKIGWFGTMMDSRDTKQYMYRNLANVGYLMSLETLDMNGDGNLDILFTDRKGRGGELASAFLLDRPLFVENAAPTDRSTKGGQASGCYWLENPGVKQAPYQQWKLHAVGGRGQEVMFLKRGDLDQDGLEDILVALRSKEILLCRRLDASGTRWQHINIRVPIDSGHPRDVDFADLDYDGKYDLIVTTERADSQQQGIVRLVATHKVTDPAWAMQPLAGLSGASYNQVKLIDLDGDHDLDLLVCEKGREGGMVWYENPERSQPRSVVAHKLPIKPSDGRQVVLANPR